MDLRPVLIACPETFDLVPTGVQTARRDDVQSSRLIGCPSCGGEHDWTPDDAVLAEVAARSFEGGLGPA